MEQATIVKLITSDGQSRDVLYNIIKLNKTIAAMIDGECFFYICYIHTRFCLL